MFHITPFYAALLALLFIGLSVNVILGRRTHRVALGVAGIADLEWRVRVHANFAEYVPLALILLAMLELRGAPAALLHTLGLALLAGRLAHAWGLSPPGRMAFRSTGVVLTFVVMIVAALALLVA